MRRLCYIVATATWLTMVSTAAGPPGASAQTSVTRRGNSERSSQVDRLFSKWDRPDVPGCAVGVIRQGELVYSRGFGAAHLGYQVPNTPRTVFDIGSFSKAITCMCVARLMDDGKLSPDDELRRFVPEMHDFNPPIRVAHLIRCHSGVWAQFHIMPLAGWDNVPIQSPYAQEDALAVLSGQKRLPFEPGTQFRYGTGDYFLLGLIVERVSGKTLAEFAKQQIFDPLNMERSFIEEDPSRVVPHQAVGHYEEADGSWHWWKSHGYLAGGSGTYTCVEDLYRWDQNFAANRLPTGRYLGEFLREGTLLGNRFVLDADAYLKKTNTKSDEPPGQYRGLKRMQFTGGVFGMSAALARFPEQQFSVICLSNNGKIAPWTMAAKIADLYLADKLRPRLSTGAPPEPQREHALSPDELKSKVGVFQSEDGILFRITLEDGQLHNTNTRGETYRLKPLSASRFLPTAYPEDRFVFERASPDEPESLTLLWRGGAIAFDRVELVDPARLDLQPYAGQYLSDELAVPYRFRVQDHALWMRVAGRRWECLEATLRDEFVPRRRHWHENRRIRFHRDEQDRVYGMTISFWRVKGVDFAKQ